ncbi:RelA/SpoT family protein [Candidatus Vondammii sp. HM_W22]|uniref:RelA/SpoT family protein n=1 Tax=Candidatus Vondammii sp. HM_W22 TaxID=2687299 RepID=UPI001F140266|nr:bifunctional (p)ppGpp synthetase/guanosine-3',5'-bis(diphosphate) 3'-pyrophosphohydrolase [Candidatus Vondammii sp. HM_W22]
MVSITTNLPSNDSLDEQDVRLWLDGLAADRSADEMDMLRRACDLAMDVHQEALEATGETTLRHALAVAEILDAMGLDSETLVAAILHDVIPRDEVGANHLEELFSPDVVHMVQDMGRIGYASRGHSGSCHKDELEHAENLRRMLLSIADDIRVVLIVLAERLHVMRILKNLSEQVRIEEALGTQKIYAPLANRLGIWQIKWEMEDLCLRYLEPKEYKEIAGNLDGRRAEREAFIAGIIDRLQEKFNAVGIDAEISGRPKHIYSIWKKMKRKSVGIDQIFDLRAVRILVGTVAECYSVLGIIHGQWRHIPGEFDDYIATPKTNMYSSIHTAVIGPEDKTLEIQIRTHEMHDHAELGVAAHWQYKEGAGKSDVAFDRRIILMRNWLELQDETETVSEDFVDNLKSEFEAQQVYVLTPHGKVIELPKGATAVDFAYAIHSGVGDRCKGSKINGRIAPLTQPLESGQTVSIITSKEGGPSRDWLSPHLGYIATSKARNRVRHWFKQQDYDTHLHTGRSSLEREVHRLGVSKPNLEQVAKRYNFQKSDDLLAAIGRGEVSPIQVAGMGVPAEPGKETEAVHERPKRRSHRANKGRSEVIVEGVDDLLTHMARCCKPVPCDDVVGFITRGRGVTVHRRNCAMIRNLKGEEQDRLAQVTWADRSAGTTYPVDIQVIAGDRKGLLRDLSSILTNEEVDVIGVNTQSSRKIDRATMRFTVEITDMRQLSRILEKMAQLPDVIDVRRQA